MKEYRVKVYDYKTEWFNLEGKLHREDGPAVEYASGTNAWYINGQLHREDGPAVEWNNGTKSWYLNGINLTKKEFKQRMNSTSCSGKIVEIDGKKYILIEI